MAVKKSRGKSRAYAVMQEVNSTLKSSVLKLGNDPYFEVVRIPSGSLTIDRITGGGFALGRHIEIFGAESACKTLIAYRTMALSQQRGNLCGLIDPEHSFDPVWFEHLGGYPEELIISWPEIAEEAVEAMMLLFKKGLEVITVDSVAALATKEEAKKAPTEEAKIASQARFMSANLRRLTTYNEKTLVLWMNQNRTKIGTFFGNPTTQPGGLALKYYDTARIELRRGEQITKPGKKVNTKSKLVDSSIKKGYWVYAKAHKNKVSREGLEGTFAFNSEEGEIDLISEIIQLGLEDRLITRTDRTFKYVDYDGIEWNGIEKNFKKMIKEDDGLREELQDYIYERTLELAYPKPLVKAKKIEADDEDVVEDEDDDGDE